MCKWVIQLVLFSGMLPVFTQALITIKPSAAINSTEYAEILLPDEIITGWHRAAVNHFTFERMQLIGHDHPDDRYLSLKLFWPKKISPYMRFGKITFFKCINRTPAAAKALMHIIRGGIGTSELALEVIYAPVQRALINPLIISCDIYAQTSDLDEKGNNFFLNLFKVRVPDTVQTEKEISILSTTVEKTTPMVNVSSVISEMNSRSQAESEETKLQSGESIEIYNGERLFDSERSPKPNIREFYHETSTQSTDVTVAYTESMALKMNVETTLASFKLNEKNLRVNFPGSEDEKARGISLSEEAIEKSGKPVLQSRNTNTTQAKGMKLEDSYEKLFANETRPNTDRTTFFNELTSETRDETIDNFEVTTLKINRQAIPPTRTSLGTTITSLWTDGTSLQKDYEDSEMGRMKKINQSKETSEKFGESIQQNEKIEMKNQETQANEYSDRKSPGNVTKTESKTNWNSEFTSKKKDTKTLYIETTTLKIDQTILLDDRTTLATNEISSQSNKLATKAHCACSENESSRNEKKNGAKSTESISDLKISKTTEASLHNSQISLGMDVVTTENREGENPSGKESIEKPVTSRWYNLAVNALPKGSRRKMGLAKIIY